VSCIARDTQLQRQVALKLLPDHFAGDLDRLSRFEREAQALASEFLCHEIRAFKLECSERGGCWRKA
jgi:hypothetical protein